MVKALEDKAKGRFVVAENNQLAIDVERLKKLNHSVEDVARFLKQLPSVFAAFTEEEVNISPTAVRKRD